MSKEKKKFKETAIGKFISEKVPGVLDVVDDYFPPAKILTALVGKNLPPEDQIEFDKLLRDHEREMYALEIDDRKDARSMQEEALKQQDSFSKRFIYYFSIFWSWFSAAYLAGITFVEIPKENIRVVDTVLGFILGTAIAAMFSFFYGSSIPRDTLKTGPKDPKAKWF